MHLSRGIFDPVDGTGHKPGAGETPGVLKLPKLSHTLLSPPSVFAIVFEDEFIFRESSVRNVDGQHSEHSLMSHRLDGDATIILIMVELQTHVVRLAESIDPGDGRIHGSTPKKERD